MSGDDVMLGLGWLDGSARTPVPDEVVDVLGSRFGRSFEMAPVGFYGRRLGFAGGRASVAWDGRRDAKGTTRAEVTQTALDGLGLEGSVGLLRDLEEVGYRASRLDEWLDDPLRRITPAKVRTAVRQGQVVTHARPGILIRDDQDGRETYYLGRAQSDRRSRCYDRTTGWPRYELQSRRTAARHAASTILAAAEPTAAIVNNLVSFADFRRDRGRSDGRRAPRLGWWAAVVGDQAHAVPAPPVPDKSIDELAAYFRGHWSRRLAELYVHLGPEWLNDVLRDGMNLIADDEQQEGVA